MLDLIHYIPHPTGTEALVSLEMLFLLYAPKKFMDIFIDREVKTLKKRINAYHKKHHLTLARWCTEDDCRKLAKASPRSQTQPPEDLVLMVPTEGLELS